MKTCQNTHTHTHTHTHSNMLLAQSKSDVQTLYTLFIVCIFQFRN